jgi:hypothetical protein
MIPLKVSGTTFQSGARHPAVSKMTAQTATPRTEQGVEQGRELDVGGDVRGQRDPEQRQREQDEFDGYSEQKYRLDHHGIECALKGCGRYRRVISAPSAMWRFR